MSVPAVHVIRNGFVEGIHRASAVVIDAHGHVTWSIGDVDAHIFPRSSNKLMQALAMKEAGLTVKNELLSLTCASHSGEDIHLAGVHAILNAANLDVDALQCPPDWPLDDVEKDSLLAQGIEKQAIHMNCSGKHASMLLTCVINGWDTETYLALDHPLQVAIQEVIERCTGTTAQHVGIDGCGAPLVSTSLLGLARSFSQFAGPQATANQREITQAVLAHPEYESGTRRDDYRLMQGVPGLIAKLGAEAVYAIGLPDGRALALKIEDGADRARAVLASAILKDIMNVQAPIIDEQLSLPILGGGKPVGEVRAVIH